MKERRSAGSKRAPQPPHIIRHYETLSPEETEEVVESVADVIVNFVQKAGVVSQATNSSADCRSPRVAQGSRRSGKGKKRR